MDALSKRIRWSTNYLEAKKQYAIKNYLSFFFNIWKITDSEQE